MFILLARLSKVENQTLKKKFINWLIAHHSDDDLLNSNFWWNSKLYRVDCKQIFPFLLLRLQCLFWIKKMKQIWKISRSCGSLLSSHVAIEENLHSSDDIIIEKERDIFETLCADPKRISIDLLTLVLLSSFSQNLILDKFFLLN